jgi:hypothetical protein
MSFFQTIIVVDVLVSVSVFVLHSLKIINENLKFIGNFHTTIRYGHPRGSVMNIWIGCPSWVKSQ